MDTCQRQHQQPKLYCYAFLPHDLVDDGVTFHNLQRVFSFAHFLPKCVRENCLPSIAKSRGRIYCSLVREDARDDEIRGVIMIFEAICSKISTFYFDQHTRSSSQSWFPQWVEGRQNVVLMSLRYNRGHDYYCRNDKCQISCQIMPLYYWLQCNIGRGFDFYVMKYCTIWNCSMNSRLSCVWCEFVFLSTGNTLLYTCSTIWR